jgi:glutaredoxin
MAHVFPRPLPAYGLIACGALAVAVAAGPVAQAQQVYRYTDKDGKVVYTDRQPPADSKDVQPKKLTPNFIENSELPYDAAQATTRFPVTLYTFACGEVCQRAEAMLNRRGVPFTAVNFEEPKGAEQLKNLTGELQAPVLQVGDKLVAKGFNETKWQSLLDEAGYPKTLPPRRAAVRAPEPPPSRGDATAAVNAPTAGGGYPK